MYAHLLRGNRDIFVTALGGSSRAASGRPEAVADDERGKEVRLADSTGEAGEQSGTSRGGAGGGKRWDQEECELQSTVRTQSREAVSQAQIAYVELSPGARRRSSQRSCTTSRSTSCGRPSSI